MTPRFGVLEQGRESPQAKNDFSHFKKTVKNKEKHNGEGMLSVNPKVSPI